MKAIIDIFSGIEYDELFPLLKKYGFDGFFSKHNFAPVPERIKECRELADKYGLIYETSHAYIHGCTTLWQDGVEGDGYIDILLKCIDNCAEFDIPILVVHVELEKDNDNNLEIGLKRLRKAVDYAGEKGVKIAFENINSPEYLIETLNYFTDANVGFCYDCGHNWCYAPDVDYLDILGNRLLCTHLHDNFGDKDTHHIPFEATFDFERMCKKLKDIGYKGNLTLEMCYTNYKDKYTKDEFVAESKRAYDKILKMMQ